MISKKLFHAVVCIKFFLCLRQSSLKTHKSAKEHCKQTIDCIWNGESHPIEECHNHRVTQCDVIVDGWVKVHIVSCAGGGVKLWAIKHYVWSVVWSYRVVVDFTKNDDTR